MQDSKTSVSGVIAYAMWSTVILLILVAWTALALGYWQEAILIGLTGCATSAGAAVAHIRCFAIRIGCMIRRLHGLECDDEPAARPTMRRVT